MTCFYLDKDWLDCDYKSDPEDWESITSEIPEWFEEDLSIVLLKEERQEESKLIIRVAILVIVWLIDIDVVVIVIELQQSGVIVHYHRRSW
jgi:hypothetical protein